MTDIFILLGNYYNIIFSAFITTVLLVAGSLAISLFFGVILGLLSCNIMPYKISKTTTLVTFTVRSVPIYVQILIYYFALPELLHFQFSPLATGILCIGVCSSCYMSQILKGAINVIPKEQWQAAYVLGYSKMQSFVYVILPQALRNSLYGIIGEIEQLVKTTSIVSMIGVSEITRVSMNIVSREMEPVPVYSITAILYVFIASTIFAFTRQIRQENTL